MSTPMSPQTPASSHFLPFGHAEAQPPSGGRSAAPSDCLGPTDPISTAPPTPADEVLDRLFREQVRFTVESDRAGERRANVLARLEKLTKTWVSKLLMKKGFQQSAEEHGGRILTFGSYHLGVHFPGADIDTLCIAPRDVDREDFFDTLVNILRRHQLVSELNPVREAHVPVIKMKFDGVPIDLVFTPLNVEKMPPPTQFDLLSDGVLNGIDDPSQRSLNGARVAEKLLNCVPSPESFRWALRGVKLWARNRGIYGNIYGFPGGVAWAIMTARVCQLHPNASSAPVLRAFFKFFSSAIKEDGTNQPIYLTRTLEVSPDFSMKSWDPRKNALEVFPVITPMVPYMNSCYNVGRPNLKILCAEFRRANEILDSFKECESEADFDELWKPSNFFLRYKVFLQIQVSANDPASFSVWSAYVESKIRHLVAALEKWTEYAGLQDQRHSGKNFQVEIRVWPFMFREDSPQRLIFDRETADRERRDEEALSAGSRKKEEDEDKVNSGYFYIGLDTCEQEVLDGKCRQMVDFEGAVDSFQQSLYTDIKTEAMHDPRITLVRRRNLPTWVLMEHEQRWLNERMAQYRQRRSQRSALRAERKRAMGVAESESGSAAADGDAPPSTRRRLDTDPPGPLDGAAAAAETAAAAVAAAAASAASETQDASAPMAEDAELP
eukprot:TRINITY_DN7855_c3_g1_i1.p1 TRINITY_DN7855_c3_g1~~TRINITY_DN7855_c3_g1_i1.p1  ORF type:complete len:688 (+),score=195.26 TRINITY_DN7855_c3_g1_i1:67-2064(+)